MKHNLSMISREILCDLVRYFSTFCLSLFFTKDDYSKVDEYNHSFKCVCHISATTSATVDTVVSALTFN